MSMMDEILGVKKKPWESQKIEPPVSVGNSSAMTVAQHVATFSSFPYVPSVQSPINPFLDARKKNDLSKLQELPIPCISSVTDNLP